MDTDIFMHIYAKCVDTDMEFHIDSALFPGLNLE